MAWDILTQFGEATITTGGTSSAAGTATDLPNAIDTGIDSRLGMICGLNLVCYVEGPVAIKATDQLHVYLYEGDTAADADSDSLLRDYTPEKKAYNPGDRIVMEVPKDHKDWLAAAVHVVSSTSTGTNGVKVRVVLERG